MKRRALFVSLAVLGIALCEASPAGAHRVDEYLQATRIAMGVDRIDLEIDLTPGMRMASQVAGWIDANGDGSITGTEGNHYGHEMLRSLTLSVDGRSVPISFVGIQVPELRGMQLGTGTIRVRAAAVVPATGAGQHRVLYSNTHRSESSVYLVNALVPADSRIQIHGQRRDTLQHSLTLEYTVAADPTWTPLLLVGLAAAGVLGVSWLPRPSFPT
jgi:hypothetical protein